MILCFEATVQRRLIYECDGQVSTYFWPHSVNFEEAMCEINNAPGNVKYVRNGKAVVPIRVQENTSSSKTETEGVKDS